MKNFDDKMDTFLEYVLVGIMLFMGIIIIGLVGAVLLAFWESGLIVFALIVAGGFLFGLATREFKKFLDKHDWL